ncbi:MAG: molybdopterin-dependent oxidoreductase [Planctomycetota bacterium]
MTSATTTLHVGGECAARELELDAAALAAAPARYQVPDVSTLAPGRRGRAVRLGALAELAGAGPEARPVHVASLDGGFTANVDAPEALAGGLVLYELDGEPLPAKFGGPFRLLVVDEGGEGADCSINVKFLGQVLFLREPGSHTAACAD